MTRLPCRRLRWPKPMPRRANSRTTNSLRSAIRSKRWSKTSATTKTRNRKVAMRSLAGPRSSRQKAFTKIGASIIPYCASPAVAPLTRQHRRMLAQLLDMHGLPARVQPFTDVASARSFKIDAPDAPLVCLSYFGSAGNPAHVRYLIRRLRRVMPNTQFLACFWMLFGDDNKAEDWRAAVGADLVATSLSEALEICVKEAQAHTGPAVAVG